jgi:hypothetical protein
MAVHSLENLIWNDFYAEKMGAVVFDALEKVELHARRREGKRLRRLKRKAKNTRMANARPQTNSATGGLYAS